MDEIRIVGPGKTRGYPYPVCKKKEYVWRHLKFFYIHHGYVQKIYFEILVVWAELRL